MKNPITSNSYAARLLAPIFERARSRIPLLKALQRIALGDFTGFSTSINDFFDAVREPMLILGENLQVVAVNKAFLNIFRVSKRETLKRNIYEVGDGQLNILPFKSLIEKKLSKAKQISNYEIKYKFKLLGEKTMSFNVRKINPFNISSSPLTLISIEDLTDRRRLEAENSRFQAVMKYIPVGIIIADAPNAKIRLVSEYWQKVLGRPAKTLENLPAGKHAKRVKIFRKDGLPPGPEEIPIVRTVKGEKIVDEEWMLEEVDGKRITILANGGPIKNKKRKIIGGVIAWRDITKHKEIDERKDEFFSVASHEMKTPLTNLKIFSQVLRKQLEVIKETPSGLLLRMESQIDKLTKIINDFLDISKIQAGKLELAKKAIDINRLVRETAENFQDKTEKHKIIVWGRTGKKPRGDESRIEEVINNLLDNAVKYSPNANKVIVKISPGKDNVKVSVQDFGVGIPKEKQEHLFEKFYRGEKEDAASLGMGLYICSQIIDLHGGMIGMSSTPGKGSTFWFTLPIYKQAEKQTQISKATLH